MLKLRPLTIFLLPAVLFLSSAIAQTGTGTLRGVMTDDSGGVIPAANVTLIGKGVTKTAQTQVDGSYVFQGLAPGQYTVKVAFPGFAPVSKPVNVTPGSNLVHAPATRAGGRKAGDHRAGRAVRHRSHHRA